MTVFQDKTVAEYLLTEDKSLIDIILQNVKPKKVIRLKFQGKYYEKKPRVISLFDIEYKWVISIKKAITGTSLESVRGILAGVYGIKTEQQFYNCSVFDVFAAYAWITEEVVQIYEAEKMKLYKKPTQKQMNAGIEEFEQLEDIPNIDGLAGGDMTKWNEILEMPYGQVLRKMLLNKLHNEYNERYSKLK